MRHLAPAGQALDDDAVAAFYTPPRHPWLRAVFVSTLDGAATGADGRTGTINNEVDHRIFALLRERADVVLVGASTAAIEGYTGLSKPLVLVSSTGRLPDRLHDAQPGLVRIAVPADAPQLAEATEILGADNVIVVGTGRVDLGALRARLHDEFAVINCEGGPRLLGSLLATGLVDEIDLTITPMAVGGDHPRIVTGAPLEVDFTLAGVLGQDSTLVGRWVRRQTPTEGTPP
ncbi:dihydrofolate reductase family protein [soil metagenome]